MLRRILVASLFLLCLFSDANAATRRYISKSGNDTYRGTWWDEAWLTLANVNDTTKFKHGDTAIFGTGIWREPLYVISGTGANKTCYIDSAFLSGQHDSRVAWIYGSDFLSGWTRIGATSVYIVTRTPANTGNATSLWQNDSLIWRQADSASVNSAGKWWYGNGHIIAWVYGGNDPDNYDMEIATRSGVIMSKPLESGDTFGGQDNVSIVGLGFKYFNGRGLTDYSDGMMQQGWDSCLISHCYFSNNAGWGGINPSLIFTGRAGMGGTSDPWPSGPPDGYDYNRIVACSIGTVYSFSGATGVTLPQTDSYTNGDGMNFYGMRYSVIDSNVFFGYQSTNAIYFKCVNDASSGGATWDTLRFNVFNSTVGTCLMIFGGTHHTSIYGNIFAGTGSPNGVCVNYSSLGVDSSGYHKIYNNTFYNRRIAQGDFNGSGYSYTHKHNEFKYNVFYRTTGGVVTWLDTLRFWDAIDSNLYYAASGTNDWVTPSQANYYATHNTFAQWQGRGVDIHSYANVNPGFQNAANGDFSRPSATERMFRIYDIDTMRIYGAVQGTVSPQPLIGRNPSSLSFAAEEGGANPPAQLVAIFNAGSGTLNWSISSGAAWLDVTPTIGSGSADVSVSVDITGLTAGSYSANLTISATGAGNSPLQLPVSLTVSGVDNTAPVISGVTGVGLASSTASNIYWNTDEPATSQVEYGLSQTYGSFSALDAALITNHIDTLTGLAPDTVYHYRVISRDASDNQATSGDNTFRTFQPSSNLALGRPVTVSGSYSGYSPTRATDGIIAPSGGASGTWASDQSASPHWVEIDLQQNVVVRSLRIYWANNTATSRWMRSQSYIVQAWSGSAFVDLTTVDNRDTTTYPDTVITYDSTGAPTGFSVTVAGPSEDVQISATDFPLVTTSRIRIYQPSNMGPESYSSIMWLTEVEVYSEDNAPPQIF